MSRYTLSDGLTEDYKLSRCVDEFQLHAWLELSTLSRHRSIVIADSCLKIVRDEALILAAWNKQALFLSSQRIIGV